jgi:3'(2'), 5'-bisphosphate nucleotidase
VRQTEIENSVIDLALLTALSRAVGRASAAVLTVAAGRFDVREKVDHSPVTQGDERSQTILLEAVAKLMPGVTVIAEEMAILPKAVGDLFILIDPLDGTKEFVAGSSEYTVNLGIVCNGTPIAGIIAAPAKRLLYRGTVGEGAQSHAEVLAITDGAIVAESSARPIRVRVPPRDQLVAVVSRSHLDDATVALLDRLGVARRIPCGSALKFCCIAEGAADLYPRLATTCEWDVAAGHALIRAAGGSVVSPGGETLRYGAADCDFRVPAFLACGGTGAELLGR